MDQIADDGRFDALHDACRDELEATIASEQRQEQRAYVVVRCKNGHERRIYAGEVPAGGFPMCEVERCYRPMFPISSGSTRA